MLDSLLEQQDYIFVTAQVVAEVQRNKLKTAKDFLAMQLERIRGFGMPDHLFEKDTANKLDQKIKIIKEVERDWKMAASETLQRISRSEDEVSKASLTTFPI